MSIYAEPAAATGGEDAGSGGLRQSSRVVRVGTGGGGANMHEELLPEYAEADPDPASQGDEPAPGACIAEFKEKREKREIHALGVLLGILLLASIAISIMLQWGQRDLNPSTNPFKEGVNGTLAYTPFGLRVYTDLYAANVWLMCAIVATPLDHQALAAKLRWGDLAAGRLPSPAAVGVWVLFTTYTPLLDLSIAAKYGWSSAFLPWAIWMRYLIFGRLQFAGAPVAGKHPLLRQLTLPEHLMLERLAWALGPYPAFDLYCIHTGQWDGKTIGRPGGVLLVVTELAVVLLWWVTWARHVFKPPNNGSLEDRGQILVKAYLSGIAQLPIQQLLHAIALWSDQPDNDELTTLEGAATNGFDVRRPFSKSLHAYHQLQFEINVDLCQQLTEHCRPP
jgi:hypothetical protein